MIICMINVFEHINIDVFIYDPVCLSLSAVNGVFLSQQINYFNLSVGL